MSNVWSPCTPKTTCQLSSILMHLIQTTITVMILLCEKNIHCFYFVSCLAFESKPFLHLTIQTHLSGWLETSVMFTKDFLKLLFQIQAVLQKDPKRMRFHYHFLVDPLFQLMIFKLLLNKLIRNHQNLMLKLMFLSRGKVCIFDKLHRTGLIVSNSMLSLPHVGS